MEKLHELDGRMNQRNSFQFIRSLKSIDLTGYNLSPRFVFVRDEIAERRDLSTFCSMLAKRMLVADKGMMNKQPRIFLVGFNKQKFT